MRNPLKKYITEDEQRILIFLITLALIGLFARYTAIATNNHAEAVDSLNLSQNYEIKYNLNNINKAELTTIPGIGEKRAEDILSYQKKNGFHSKRDLMKVKGIGKNTFLKIEKYFFDMHSDSLFTSGLSAQNKTTEDFSKININTANIDELTQLKGIGPVKAKQILELRNKLGKFENVDQLLNIKGIGPKTLNKIKNRIILGGE